MKRVEVYPVRVATTAQARLAGVMVFTVLLWFSAWIKIPLFFTPVPITLQTMVVLLAGAFLGPYLGTGTIVMYIGLGILGAPLFAGMGSGLLYLAGPTAGYLYGFLLASWLVGFLIQVSKTQNLFCLNAIMLLGIAVIYCVGGFWLKAGYGWSLNSIWLLGVVPFIAADVFKAFLAAAIFKHCQR